MLIATAGHVDHGKTSLVHALTGVDTDRLPEEKTRGLTIDLGFAYRELDSGITLGFVDVPGHEKFIRNMLAGVSAIDLALLVVAADDGVMPQTEEHLAILELIGIGRGAVALTKIDRVDADRIEVVTGQVRALLDSTPLAGASVFPVCAPTGEGIEALEQYLIDSASQLDERSRTGHFRLAIDRAFSVAGSGMVVTGTAFSGEVHAGDRMRIQPRGTEVRVRGLHSGHRKTNSGVAGQRLAVNIIGADLAREELHRGDWLVSEPLTLSSRRLDARLRVLSTETKPLAHWSPVHVHVGAGFLTGRVAVLEDKQIAPGEDALVQLYLDRPAVCVAGDRFIVRDQSARRTLGGGAIIDPLPPLRGRARPERIATLVGLEQDDHREALLECLEHRYGDVDLDDFARARNLTVAESQAIYDALGVVEITIRRRRLGLTPRQWQAIQDQLTEHIGAWHQEHPDQVGPDEGTASRGVAPGTPRGLVTAALRALIRSRRLVRDGQSVRLADHTPKLSGADQRLWQAVSSELSATATKPLVVTELAAKLDVQKPALIAFLNRCIGRRQLIRIADNRYFHPQAVARLAKAAEDLAQNSADHTFDAKSYRDRSGIGRNLTIQVLEYFDAVGLTRRLGDQRIVVGQRAEIFGETTE